ncbi:YidC/Oxa1 family membrane protein insertase [Helicobacter sp. 23-1045]
MSELLYYIFIFPLESVLGFILANLFMAIKSYGFSIIILGLLVNIFLLKIFNLTDKKAEFEAERKKRLDSRIKAWKSVYKKAKLFAFTQTLYRQNHYHPIYALSALGGLAVQIPFFYAMYFVIKNAEMLNGVSFLWIADLSAPDNVLGVHLLPILMTIISLINVWIVAKDRGAKIQGAVISLIFLVLLYQMPSALVLYWTTNMAFSLLRALWAKWRSNSSNSLFNNHSADSAKQINMDCHDSASQNLAMTENDADSVNRRISHKFAESNKIKSTTFFTHRKGLFKSIIALTALLIVILLAFGTLKLSAPHSAKLTLENGEAKMHYALNPFLRSKSMTSDIEIIGVAWDKSIDSSAMTLLGNHQRNLQFLSDKPLNLKNGDFLGVAHFTMDNTPFVKNLFIYYFAILGAIFGVYLLLCVISRFQSYREANAKIYRQTAIYAVICISFLICVFNPYALYNSDVSQFESSQTKAMLSALFGAFLLISFSAIYMLSFIARRFSNFVAFILSVILFSGIAYSFVFVGDYGAMDHFILQIAPQKSAWQIVEFIMVLSLGIALTAFALTKLKRAMQVILATLFIVSGVNAVQIANKRLESNTHPLTPSAREGEFLDSNSAREGEQIVDSANFTKNAESSAESPQNALISAPPKSKISPLCPTQNLRFFHTPKMAKISW